MDPAANLSSQTFHGLQPYNHLSSQQHHRKREASFCHDFESPLPKFCKPSSLEPANHCGQRSLTDAVDSQEKQIPATAAGHDGDLRSVLINLYFIEQKIHQLQDFVKLSEEFEAQPEKLVMADITSIIVQLISTAGSLLPTVKNNLLVNPGLGQLQSISEVGFTQCYPRQIGQMGGSEPEHNYVGKPYLSISNVEEHVIKNEEDAEEGKILPPGSYEVLQVEKEEILAPHAHLCLICGKGFKRDANLRMHMRGHGDEYKTIAALAKPCRQRGLETMQTKRYSCPYAGCKRNKDHINFRPLKSMLCVKNHYKRTHCDKNYTCSRCNRKMFSVLADLKTHEKHCGRDKLLCSCGTTFSRKDKLFGHVALFQGHTPALPSEESKGSCGIVNGEENHERSKIGGTEFSFSPSFTGGRGVQNDIDGKGSLDDPTTFFSSLDFDSFFAGFHDFPPPPFEISENSLACPLAE